MCESTVNTAIYSDAGREEQPMTLVLAFKRGNSILMVADSCETFKGLHKSPSKVKKLFKITRNCVMGIAYNPDWGVTYKDELVKTLPKKENIPASEIAETLHKIIMRKMRTKKDRRILKNRVIFLLGGFNRNPNGELEPVLYRLNYEDDYTPCLARSPDVEYIGGYSLSVDWVDQIAKVKDLSKLLIVGSFLIFLAEKTIAGIATPANAFYILPEGAREVETDEINKAHSKAEPLVKQILDIFSGAGLY